VQSVSIGSDFTHRVTFVQAETSFNPDPEVLPLPPDNNNSEFDADGAPEVFWFEGARRISPIDEPPQGRLVNVILAREPGIPSTVDSQLLALGSIATDYTKDSKKQKLVMIVGAVIALIIANIPGNSVLFMFLVYGTLRATTLSITVLTLIGVKLRANAVFAGLLVAMSIGFPAFVYGNLNNITDVRLWGSIFTATIAGVIAYAITAALGKPKASHKKVSA
jgi:hypothetical protein